MVVVVGMVVVVCWLLLLLLLLLLLFRSEAFSLQDEPVLFSSSDKLELPYKSTYKGVIKKFFSQVLKKIII